MNVSVTLGKTPIEAEIRTGGGKSWIQVDGKWYAPARRTSLSSTTGTSLPAGVSTSNLDAGKILAAIGDPVEAARQCLGFERHGRRYRFGQSVGRCQHRGRLRPLPQMSPRAWAIAAATAPSQAEIDKTVAQLNKIINKAHVDIWVGKSDHKVHRVAFSVDAAMD